MKTFVECSDGKLLKTRVGHVAVLTMNRPEKLNALDRELFEGLLDALQEIQEDESVHVAVITGAGRGFCSGRDLGARGDAIIDEFPKHDYSWLNSRYIWALRFDAERLDKPLIAAVNGVAAGGGLIIALGCDIRIASESASFTPVFLKNLGTALGDGISALLPRIVGPSNALRMILTEHPVEANEALRIGLVNEVVPDAALMETSMKLAAHMAEHIPESLRYAKRAVYRSLHTDPRAQLDYEEFTKLKLFAMGDKVQEWRRSRRDRYQR